MTNKDGGHGKMHINELWNQRLQMQIAAASRLLELQNVMSAYKRNIMKVKQIDLEQRLDDELADH